MIEEKLKALNVKIPEPPKPAGAYVPVVISGSLAYVSGQIPIQDGKVGFVGKVPTDKSIEEAQKAAKLCIINGLSQLKGALGNLDRIKKIIRISGFVNSSPEFTKQPFVINAASEFLYEVFGDIGRHSRIAVGASSLPLDATVEIDMIVEIS